MKKTLAIIIGFAHDWAAGCWGATVLGVWWLERVLARHAEVSFLLGELQRDFFWIGVACVVVVMATGAGRTFTYVEGFYGPDAEARRRRLLIVKHVILLVLFGAGTIWQWSLAFR